MWLLDKDENLKEKLKLTSAVHSQTVNGANTITFECTNKIYKYDRVIYRDEMLLWHEFIVQRVNENKNLITVYAENSAYELYADYIKDKRPTDTALHHLSMILENTRFEPGNVEVGDSFFVAYYYITKYEAIQKLCQEAGAEIRVRITVDTNKITHRYIDILQQVGSDVGKRFVYSKDLQDVERTILDDEIYTALVGRGKGEEIGDGYGRRITFESLDKSDSPQGIEYVSDEEALERWGILDNGIRKHRIGIVEFDEIEDVEELYASTKTKLQQVKDPQINYECSVTLLNDDHENVGIGDVVTIIDEDFNGEELRIKGRVIQFEKDLVYPENSTVILGNFVRDLSRQSIELQEYVDNFRSRSGVWDRSNAFDENNQLEGSYIKELLKAWNDSINTTGGYVYAETGAGIIAYDQPIEQNPTKATQFVGGGIRIANSKLPNGDWDWRTVMTGDGIAGQEIVANSITANQLSSDVGASLDISSNNSIHLLVSNLQNEEIDRKAEDNRIIEETTSSVSQLSDSLTLQFTRIDGSIGEVTGDLKELKTYFKFDENGVIIGKNGSPVTLNLVNDRIEFRENGVAFAYWEGGTMSVDNIIAEISVLIGTHLVTHYDSPVVGASTLVRQVN